MSNNMPVPFAGDHQNKKKNSPERLLDGDLSYANQSVTLLVFLLIEV